MASGPALGAQPLTLASQSFTVTGTSPFHLEVVTGPNVPAPGDLELDVTLYDRLNTRSALEQSLTSASPTTARLGSTGEVALSSLAPGDGTYQVSVGLQSSAGSSPPPFVGSPISLDCPAGLCVFPAVVALDVRSSGHELSHFTTFLTYETAPPSTRLRVATVLPVASPAQPRTGAGAGNPAGLRLGELQRLSSLISAVAKSPTAETLVPVPRTLQDLAASGSAGSTAMLTLRLLSISDSHQVLSSPYAGIRPDVLTASGLTSELEEQTARATAVLSQMRLRTTGGWWVADEGLGSGTRSAVGAMGTTDMVVPESTLVPTSGTYTEANTFTLSLGRGAEISAASADAELTTQFTAHPEDPVLAAHQMLADLDLVYSELPFTARTRGLVASPPPGWQPDVAFVDTLLQGLSPVADPALDPVTLSQFFAQVPPDIASGGGTPVRQLAGSQSGAWPGSFVSAVRAARRQWSAFRSAAPTANGVLARLDDALLVSQASTLDAPGRRRALGGFGQALGGQLSEIQLATDRTITLTSRNSALPVTILSSAPYPVTGVLALSSDKLTFLPPGNVRPVDINRSTTPVRVEVQTRTSGDLPVQVTLFTPSGGLVMVHGELTIRSTATSVVGVVLTLVALGVLLLWWARSSFRRRRAGAARELPAAAPLEASPDPDPAPR